MAADRDAELGVRAAVAQARGNTNGTAAHARRAQAPPDPPTTFPWRRRRAHWPSRLDAGDLDTVFDSFTGPDSKLSPVTSLVHVVQ